MVARYSTARLAASQRAARSLFGSRWRSDPCCRILYCGIDLAPFRAAVDSREVRAELGIPPESFVVGHVGRFTEPKNHTFLLQIAAQAIQLEPRARVLLVGDGPLRPAIERQVSELGLSGKVIFAGVRDDVPRLLKGAIDLFVFPSLHEGLGLALVEAQAAGLPCLYSDVIPHEVEVVRPLMQRLSLREPASRWAELGLSHSRQIGMPDPSAALEVVELSPFKIRRNVDELCAIYDAQVERAGRSSCPLPSVRSALS